MIIAVGGWRVSVVTGKGDHIMELPCGIQWSPHACMVARLHAGVADMWPHVSAARPHMYTDLNH